MQTTKNRFARFHSHWRRQCFKYHPEFGWWHIPKLSARLMLGQTFHQFRTNAVGMREERNFPKKTPKGRVRIVVLGDSYAAGDGVSNHRRATSIMSNRFPALDVLNFGLNGSGTDQQLLIFEKLASSYQVDAFFWFICVENIARNLYTHFPSFNWHEHRATYRPKPYFRLRGRDLVMHHVPVPHKSCSAAELDPDAVKFPYLPDEFPNDPYGIYNKAHSEHWKLMKALIRRFLRQVSPRPVFLIPLPMYQHYLEECPPGYLDRFAELESRKDNVHVLDVLPAFLGVHASARELLRFPDDPHYTEFAHSVLAQAIEYQFKRLLPHLADDAMGIQ